MSNGPVESNGAYLRAAWTDVGVALALVAGTIVTHLGFEAIKNPGAFAQTSDYILEIGFTAAVADHVAKLLWYRTFLGSLVRYLWRQIQRRNRGGPDGEGAARSGSSRRTNAADETLPAPTPRPEPGVNSFVSIVFHSYFDSWPTRCGRERPIGHVLSYPPIATGWIRLRGSLTLGIVAATIYAFGVLVSGTATSRLVLQLGLTMIVTLAGYAVAIFVTERRTETKLRTPNAESILDEDLVALQTFAARLDVNPESVSDIVESRESIDHLRDDEAVRFAIESEMDALLAGLSQSESGRSFSVRLRQRYRHLELWIVSLMVARTRPFWMFIEYRLSLFGRLISVVATVASLTGVILLIRHLL